MRPIGPILLGLLLLGVLPRPASSQTAELWEMPVPELLEAFIEQSGKTYRVNFEILGILRHESRPRGEIDALITGLAELAHNGATDVLRMQAVSLLTSPTSNRPESPSYAHIPQLILELFEETDSPLVRLRIIHGTGQLSDRSVGLRILRSVLTEERPEWAPPEQHELHAKEAVLAAAHTLGPPGLALLRELDAAGTIRDESARRLVEELKREGRLGGGGGGRE